jgi:uncharacterized protein (UPF0264 family)
MTHKIFEHLKDKKIDYFTDHKIEHGFFKNIEQKLKHSHSKIIKKS